MSSLLEDKEKLALTKSSNCKETRPIGIHTAYIIWYQCGGWCVVLSQLWKALGFCSPAFWCRQQPFSVHSTRLGSLHQSRCNVQEGRLLHVHSLHHHTKMAPGVMIYWSILPTEFGERMTQTMCTQVGISTVVSGPATFCILGIFVSSHFFYISFKEPTLITSRFCAGLMQWSMIHCL